MNATNRYLTGKAALPAILAVIVVAIGAAGAYWWTKREAGGPPPGPPEAVTLAVSAVYPGSSLIAIAASKGYFAAEGVQVTMQPYATGKLALDAAIEGKADLATCSDIVLMFAASRNVPAVVIATMSTTTGADYSIVARRDRGIASLAALKGKRIGVQTGTSGHFFVDVLLTRGHVDSSTVKFVSIPSAKLADALSAGEVDAVSTWEPYVGEVKAALGTNAESFSASGIYDSPWLLAARRDVAAKRPEAVQRFLRALLRAEQYYAHETAAAQALLAGLRKEDPAQTARLHEPFRFSVRLGQSLLGTLEDEGRWAIRAKLVERAEAPNFLEHLYPDALLAVKPELVTVIR